jgi:hypothetical protein
MVYARIFFVPFQYIATMIFLTMLHCLSLWSNETTNVVKKGYGCTRTKKMRNTKYRIENTAENIPF